MWPTRARPRSLLLLIYNKLPYLVRVRVSAEGPAAARGRTDGSRPRAASRGAPGPASVVAWCSARCGAQWFSAVCAWPPSAGRFGLAWSVDLAGHHTRGHTRYALGTHTHQHKEIPPHSNGAKAHNMVFTVVFTLYPLSGRTRISGCSFPLLSPIFLPWRR